MPPAPKPPKGPVTTNRPSTTSRPKYFPKKVSQVVNSYPGRPASTTSADYINKLYGQGYALKDRQFDRQFGYQGPGRLQFTMDDVKNATWGDGKDQAALQREKASMGQGNSNPTGSGSKGKSGGGGVSGPSTQDLINDLYNSLIGELSGQKEGALGEYDKTKGVITNQYDAAKKDLYQKYMATYNPMVEQAANLGVDYGNSSINALQDASLKRLEETGDLALASDQAYMDKMRLIQSGAFDALIQGSRNDQAATIIAAKQAAAARAAGSARRSGGGGSSSSNGITQLPGYLNETVTDSYEFPDTARYDAIQELKKTDPVAGAAEEMAWAKSLGPEAASYIDRIQQPNVKVPKIITKKYSALSGRHLLSVVKNQAGKQKNVKIDKDRKEAVKLIDDYLKHYLNTPKKTSKVTQTGTEKTKYKRGN